MDTLINFGGALKALGNGKVGGYGVQFGGKDLDDEHFTASTYFGVNDGAVVDSLFHHGRPIGAKSKIPPPVKSKLDDLANHLFAPSKGIKDEHGIWYETVLNMADDYEKMVYQLAEKGKLGYSTGAPAHMVKKTADGEITRWPISEVSFTPCPAEPRNRVSAVKSLGDDDDVLLLTTIRSVPAVKDFFSDRLPVQIAVAALSSLQDQFWYKVTDILWGYSVDGAALSIADQLMQIDDGFDEYKELAMQTLQSLLNNGAAEAAEPAEEAKSAIKNLLISGGGRRPANLPLAEELDLALAAVSAVTERTKSANELRIKSGRMLSAASLAKVKAAHGALADLLAATDKPVKTGDPTKGADLTESQKLRTETLRLQTRVRQTLATKI